LIYKKLLFTFWVVLLVFPSLLWAEGGDKFTISGYVKDAKTGEALIGANVFIKESLKGVSTNTYGYYSLPVEKGEFTLVCSYISFQDFTQKINLQSNLTINISMEPVSQDIKEVVVSAERQDKNITNTDMGQVKMDIQQVKLLPAFMGEVDILKTIQLMPGVKGSGDGNSGFYVRGGGPDQNLILLDEAVVYNASHLFGFFSVFNGDAVKGMNLIKGGMPAQYGGRLASVLDITMKEGNNQKFKVDGGIGLISSRLTVQGPLKKDKSSFIVSGRRTYIDVLMKPFVSKGDQFYGSSYYFYDLNAKINYTLSDKDRIFVSGYFGRDKFTFQDNEDLGFKATIPYGNATASLRWNHVFNSRLFMNTSLVFTDYNFEVNLGQSDFNFGLYSGIRDYNGKIDFSWQPDIRNHVRFGVNYTYHRFTPNNATAEAGDVEFDFGKVERIYGNEFAVYLSDDFDVSDKFKINAGVRVSGFQQIGPFERFVKEDDRVVDTIAYSRGQNIQFYVRPEPRLAINYIINAKSSIKAGVTMNYQYLQIANLATVSLPTDLWIPSSEKIKPQRGIQYSLGYFRNFKDNTWETSVELYYKDMRNLVEFKDGVMPSNTVNDNIDNLLTFGRGWAYGAEFFVRKSVGKTTGWLGYTLSWTQRQFDDINGGKPFFARYDRRHDVQFTLTQELSKKWTFSIIWVYSTGAALTVPVARYFIEGRVINEFGERNSYRMEPYHRMDLSLTYVHKKTDKWMSSWNFSVYNVYSRQNPYFIYFDTDGDLFKAAAGIQAAGAKPSSFRIKAKQVSLFPVIPSITWNFSF
jgi:hypothetical protein